MTECNANNSTAALKAANYATAWDYTTGTASGANRACYKDPGNCNAQTPSGGWTLNATTLVCSRNSCDNGRLLRQPTGATAYSCYANDATCAKHGGHPHRASWGRHL